MYMFHKGVCTLTLIACIPTILIQSIRFSRSPTLPYHRTCSMSLPHPACSFSFPMWPASLAGSPPVMASFASPVIHRPHSSSPFCIQRRESFHLRCAENLFSDSARYLQYRCCNAWAGGHHRDLRDHDHVHLCLAVSSDLESLLPLLHLLLGCGPSFRSATSFRKE
jgi:hypothetical protein